MANKSIYIRIDSVPLEKIESVRKFFHSVDTDVTQLNFRHSHLRDQVPEPLSNYLDVSIAYS